METPSNKKPRAIEILASPEWIEEFDKALVKTDRPKRWWAALFPIPIKTTKALIPGSAWIVWSDGTTQQIAP